MNWKEFRFNGKGILWTLLGALILSYASLYNTYPLVYSDSGTYILSGMEYYVPNDRPILYGLFIRHFNLFSSLWMIVFFQNLILSFILRETIFLLVPKKKNEIYLGIIILLTATTAISWYSNQIMPDIFTPIFLLSIFLILFNENFTLTEYIIVSSIIVFTGSTHMSNTVTGVGIAILFSLFFVVLKKKKYVEWKLLFNLKNLLAAALILSPWLIIPWLHWSVDKKWRLAESSHVHIMASLCEKGILKEYLDDHCGKEGFEDYRLCELKDDIPNNIEAFIWSGDFLQKSGGWIDSKEEFNKIIFDTYVTPKYMAMHLKYAVIFGLSQMTQINVGEGLTSYEGDTPPRYAVKKWFPKDINAFDQSRQNLWNGINLTFKYETRIQWYGVILSLILTVLIIGGKLWRLIPQKQILFLGFAFLSIFSNAFVTGFFSSIYTRLNSRMIWLLPFAIIIILSTNYSVISNYFRKSEE